ncbi:hypothetical protein [Saccharopolyspora gregorii]|uniref:GerMN domain-containing protein n=1 Tax=Saccharopolyspora gregorii TaxID=33914 RepID=A0ABP6RJS0_9PSEU|nr:hypothetical protein [Saccharopolyspora gregorii]
MKRRNGLVLALGIAVLAAGGCGVRSSGVITGSSPPSGVADPAAGTTLYLVADGRLEATTRPGPAMSRADALRLLAIGPTAEERARGLGSEVPPEAVPFAVSTRPPGRVLVSTSMPAADLSGTAVEQIVCTVAAGTPDARATVQLLGRDPVPRRCAGG